jgi:hypothetical protein
MNKIFTLLTPQTLRVATCALILVFGILLGDRASGILLGD